MAHKHQLNFIQLLANHLTKSWGDKEVLEIGSYDVNGSIRPFFNVKKYVGVDLTEGPGVDLVCGGDQVDFPDNTMDMCISCECFEHNPMWVETFQNMYRMTKKGGAVLMTCASTGRVEHGTTRTKPASSPGSQDIGWDYYKNLAADDFYKNFVIKELFSKHFFYYNKYSNDLYFVGIKTGADSIFNLDIELLNKLSIETVTKTQNSEGRFLRIARYSCFFPIYVASILPEKIFQNFAVNYLRLLSFFYRPIKKMFK
jgi:hypothetical protein